MNQKVALLVALIAFMAMGQRLSAQGLTASLAKVRGTVTQAGDGGASIRLKTGSTVPVNRMVSVGKLSVAVYKIATTCVIKQDPKTSLLFSRLTASKTSTGQEHSIGITLQKGELYTAIKHPNGEAVDYHVTTSKAEVIAHGTVFKVSHSFSTTTVSVKEGIAEVWYCYGAKKVVVHAGEVLVVTDCDGVLRWQTDDERRDMILFAALIGSAFDSNLGGGNAAMELASANQPTAVLAPEIPVGLPPISP